MSTLGLQSVLNDLLWQFESNRENEANDLAEEMGHILLVMGKGVCGVSKERIRMV